jgi:hypothetical protein
MTPIQLIASFSVNRVATYREGETAIANNNGLTEGRRISPTVSPTLFAVTVGIRNIWTTRNTSE